MSSSRPVSWGLVQTIMAKPAPPLNRARRPSLRFCVTDLPTMTVSELRREIRSPTRLASKNSASWTYVRRYSWDRSLATTRSPTIRRRITRPKLAMAPIVRMEPRPMKKWVRVNPKRRISSVSPLVEISRIRPTEKGIDIVTLEEMTRKTKAMPSQRSSGLAILISLKISPEPALLWPLPSLDSLAVRLTCAALLAFSLFWNSWSFLDSSSSGCCLSFSTIFVLTGSCKRVATEKDLEAVAKRADRGASGVGRGRTRAQAPKLARVNVGSGDCDLDGECMNRTEAGAASDLYKVVELIEAEEARTEAEELSATRGSSALRTAPDIMATEVLRSAQLRMVDRNSWISARGDVFVVGIGASGRGSQSVGVQNAVIIEAFPGVEEVRWVDANGAKIWVELRGPSVRVGATAGLHPGSLRLRALIFDHFDYLNPIAKHISFGRSHPDVSTSLLKLDSSI